MAWGKIIGGVVGAAMGGPIGAGIGIAIGAGFDGSEDEQNGNALTTQNQEAPFRVLQIGNILRLTSQRSFPPVATHVVVRVGYRNDFVKSRVPIFADDDGDFGLSKRIIDQAVTVELPMHALSIYRGVEVPITIGIWVCRDEEVLGVLEVPTVVKVSHEPWSTVRWLYPMVDLAAHYALRSESWTSEKVREMKAVFEEIAGTDPQEAEALKERLKLSPRPTLDECCAALNQRFDPQDLAAMVLPIAAGFMMRFGETRRVPPEIRRVAAKLHLSATVAEELIQALESQDQEDGRNGTHTDAKTSLHDMQRAREVLGVSEGADRDAVQQAWRRKISDYHPDKHPNASEVLQNLLKEKVQEINRARDILLG